MTDWRGNKIEVGCFIIYPCRQGSNIWVVEAEVVEILSKEIIVKPIRSAGYKYASVAKKPIHI